MVYFLDESGRQKFCYLLTDGPAFHLIEAMQALFHWLVAWVDLQGMLGDLPRNAWHLQGFPCKDVSIGVEEVDERAFLFRGKRGTNANYFALGAPGVYEDLLGALHWLEGPGRPLGVGCFFGYLLPESRELYRDDDCCGVITALNLTLVGTLKGCVNGDDPAWAWHL